jgi:drug/metabolite transporter (DMT)-like permease
LLKFFVAYCLLALSQAVIAVNVIIGKIVLERMPTFLFIGSRFLISSVFLTLLMLLLKHRVTSTTHPQGYLQTKDWGYLIAQAATGGFLFNYFFFYGLEFTTATSAGIISSTLPAAIAICAYFFLNEKLSQRKLFSIGLAMLGILVINLDNSLNVEGETGSVFGDFLILLAMVPEALYSIFNKYIGHRVTPLGSATVVNWLIFLMMLPLASLALIDTDLTQYSLSLWGLTALGGFTTAFFYWGWSKALLVIPATTAAVFGGVLPIVTSILAYFILDEHFGWCDIGGMVLVIASILIASSQRALGYWVPVKSLNKENVN